MRLFAFVEVTLLAENGGNATERVKVLCLTKLMNHNILNNSMSLLFQANDLENYPCNART